MRTKAMVVFGCLAALNRTHSSSSRRRRRRSAIRMLGGSMLVVSLAGGGPTGLAGQSTGETAIVDVTIVDIETGELQPGMTVLVSGNRIAAVAPSASLSLPPGVVRVAGDGRFVMPGLWDMHVHFSGPDRDAREIDFPLLVANGVTGVRLMSGDCVAYCGVRPLTLAVLRGWSARIEAGTQVGPRIVASSALFEGSWRSQEGSYALSTPAEGRAAVHDAKARGADFITMYSTPPDVSYAVLEEARTVGLDVAGESPGVTVAEASSAGQKSFEHVDGTALMECSSTPEAARAAFAKGRGLDFSSIVTDTFDATACGTFFDLLKANGTWQVPTLSVNRARARLDEVVEQGREYLPYLPRAGGVEGTWAQSIRPRDRGGPEAVKRFERSLSYVAAASRAGVPLLAGTDTWSPYVFAGFSLHDELALFVEAGLSPREALRTATVAPAEYFGREQELGAIRPGYLADLVVLEGNPLEDIANTRRIAAVIANGRLFRRAALDTLLVGARRAARATGVAATEPPRARDRLAWTDRRGSLELVPGESRFYVAPRLSPDGRRIAVMIVEGGRVHLWLVDVATGAQRPFTTQGTHNDNAIWAPAGDRIYFRSDRAGDRAIWRKAVDTNAEAELVYDAPGNQVPGSVSPDEAWLVFIERTGGADDGNIGLLSLNGPVARPTIVDTPADECCPVFSPDGRFIAYESDFQIHVMEVATRKTWKVTSHEVGAILPKWTRGGAELVYLSNYQVYAIDVLPGPEPSFSAPRHLFAQPRGIRVLYDVTPDGERFLWAGVKAREAGG